MDARVLDFFEGIDKREWTISMRIAPFYALLRWHSINYLSTIIFLLCS